MAPMPSRQPSGRPIQATVVRTSSLAVLGAVLVGTGMTTSLPLVLAQSAAPDAAGSAPEPATSQPAELPAASTPPPSPHAVAPPPPVPPAAQAPAPAAPPEVRVQQVATPLPAAPNRVQPGADVYRPVQPVRPGTLDPTQTVTRPGRGFDQSLDDLVRDGVVSPREREVRVRGLIRPGNEAIVQEGCSNGAFSMRECGSAGVAVRSRDGLSAHYDGSGMSAAAGGSYSGMSGDGGRGIDAAPLPPISVPVTALLSGVGGRFRLTDVFNLSPRPGALRGNGNSRLLYPLIGSSEVTSGFGWRLHPILGSWLMHSGRDLAAPEGTPVVAALSGRVASSGEAGGYGLAVEIDHDNPRRRTLYGHLSEIYVREGDRVRQGEVIGRVGSTGRSTGPHLHFEVRMPQEGGWVAVEPGDLDMGATALGPAGSVVADALQGLPGSMVGGSQPTDALSLLVGQLVQSLERPRYPLAMPSEAAGAAPSAAPFSTDRLPERLPPSASVPAPAPLPRRSDSTAKPGG